MIGVISGLGGTNWMVYLCKQALFIMLCSYSNILYCHKVESNAHVQPSLCDSCIYVWPGMGKL